MSTSIQLQPLSLKNFADFEKLTVGGKHGGCYCAFWHQKFSSIEEWHRREREAPEKNRDCIRQRIESGFHVGTLAYQDHHLLAWISISPVAEVYWAWRRVPMLGDNARTTACITCFALAPEARGRGNQTAILQALGDYGRQQGWTAIEGYPFDAEAVKKHGKDVHWPGLTKGFIESGFQRIGSHWLSNAETPRSIFSLSLNPAP